MLSMVVSGYVALYLSAKMLHIDTFFFCNGSSYILIFALSYLVGLFIHNLSHIVFDWKFRNNPCMIECAKKEFYKQLNRSREKEEEGASVVDKYYEKYYKAVPYSSAVPIMETHVSFIRSMVIVCLILIVVTVRSSRGLYALSYSCTAMTLLIVAVLLVLLMTKIQKRIYFRVLEDAHYIEIAKTHNIVDDKMTITANNKNKETGVKK